MTKGLNSRVRGNDGGVCGGVTGWGDMAVVSCFRAKGKD